MDSGRWFTRLVGILVTALAISSQAVAVKWHPVALASKPARPAALSARGAQGRKTEVPSAYRLIARATQRIERDQSEILVYRGHSPVKLPRFQELVVVRRGSNANIEELLRKSVALVRAEHSEEWEVYTDLMWRGELTLPENVFIIRQVLTSSPEHPIQLRIDGRLLQLKPGEVLLVLG